MAAPPTWRRPLVGLHFPEGVGLWVGFSWYNLAIMKKIALVILSLSAFTSAFADLYLAGDSTMCNYADRQYPQQGWGQALARYMKNPDMLHNWAVGGRSAKSYKAEGRWQKIVDALKPGDFVIIAFGHNDANKAKTERYSSPEDYKGLMKGFAVDVKAKRATLVFATSIPHSGGITKNKDGKTHVRGSAAGIGPYVDATRKLGAELGLEVLDLNAYACKAFEQTGADDAFKLYMRIQPGEYAAHPQGKSDGCHTRDTGADFFARGAVQMCFDRKLPIATLFKEPKDVAFTPIGFNGPGKDAKPLKDDFTKDEVAYAAAPATTGWRNPLEIGNYDVTIRLGDRDKPTVNFVKFMGRRLASDRIELKAGEFSNFTFTARIPGVYTRRNKTGIHSLGLSLFCNGQQVPVTETTVTRNDSAPTIWLCGDSTVTDQKREPWGSWGQILPAFIKPGWACVNFARSGLAMATFESEGRLARILEDLKAGDWVIVQFGHNDQKRPGEEPENGYTRRYGEWLAKFRAKGARLVVVSPCERRRFDEKTGEHQGKTLAGYADAARAFAEKNALPFIDLNDITYRMQGALGADGSKPLQVDNKGKLDNTHHSIYGAYVNARIVASHLATFDGIGAAIRDEAKSFDPMHPSDPKIPASGKTDWQKPEGD